MEEGDDSIFEFGVMIGVDGSGRESFLYDGFVDVGGNEERDIIVEIVVFL